MPMRDRYAVEVSHVRRAQEPKRGVKVLEEEHKNRHKLLHSNLDELVADWIESGPSKRPSKSTILELMQWSKGQIEKPSPEVER